MSEEQLKAFWEAVQADTSLQEKLRATTDADSIASLAQEAGFEITADEVKEAQSELSEEELKGVAGGFSTSKPTYGVAEPQYWTENEKRSPSQGRRTIKQEDGRDGRDGRHYMCNVLTKS